jgi:hypothetical protein
LGEVSASGDPWRSLGARDATRLLAVSSHVELSADTASMPGDVDSLADAEVNAVTPQRVTPSPEQTGDVHRAAVPPD